MTGFRIAILFCASLACAQDSGTARKDGAAPQGAQPPADASLVRRLETVTWSPATSELSWVVSVWDTSVSLEQPVAKRSYAVRLDNGTMKFEGESRLSDPDEVRYVRVLMYVITTYAIESTVSWDYAEDAKPVDKAAPDSEKGEKGKGDNPKLTPRPGAVILHGPVAANGVRHQL